MPGEHGDVDDLRQRLREATERRNRQNRLRDSGSDDYDFAEWERAQRDVEFLERQLREAGGDAGVVTSPSPPASGPQPTPGPGPAPSDDGLPSPPEGDATRPLVDKVREARRHTAEVRGRRPDSGARRDVEGGGVQGGSDADLKAQTDWRAAMDRAEEAQAAAEGELAFEAGGGAGAFTEAERRELERRVREIRSDQQELDRIKGEIDHYEDLLDQARGLLHGNETAGGGPSAGGAAGIAAGARYQGELRELYRQQATVVQRMNRRLDALAGSILQKARRLIGDGAGRLDLDIAVPGARANRIRAEEELLRRIYHRLGLPDLPGRGADGLLGTGRRRRGLSLAPVPRPLVVALAAVVLLALVALVLVLTRGDDTARVASGGAQIADADEPAGADQSPDPAADGSADSATGADGVDGTADDSTPPATAEAGPATAVAVGMPCATVTHRPPPSHPSSLSQFTLALLAAGVDGRLADDRVLTIVFGGADAPFSAPIGADGLVVGVVPISSYGSYPVTSASVTEGAGPQIDATEAVQQVVGSVDVGPSEGPVDGCTDPSQLTPDERAAAVASLVDGGASGTDELPRIRSFLADWLGAHDRGDAAFLLSTLDEATLERYGHDQCQAYLEGVVGSVDRLEVIDGRPEPYDYALDGRSTVIEDAWTVTVELGATGEAQTTRTDIHLHPTPDGIRWFTDCGDPT